MYSLDEFGEMVGDELRFSAYCDAIAKAVRPGDVAVDIGTGPGVLALLAAKAGARKVYAIDTENIVEFGRQFAATNGMTGRIEFLRGNSRQILLPERANIIISDIRGALPLFGQSILALNEARERLLAEGGRMIPERDLLLGALVEAPKSYQRIVVPWRSVPGLDLEPALPIILNSIYKCQLRSEQLLTEAHVWHELDYINGANPRAGCDLEFVCQRPGTAHGFAIWFQTRLFSEIGFSTQPGPRDSVYGQIFLPLLRPVDLAEGETIRAGLHADLVGTDYVWRWEFELPESSGREAVNFKQSTFQGGGFSPSSLRKRAAEFVPVLSEAGIAERWLLTAMDGKTPLDQLAIKAAEQFPHTFARVEDAFRRAGEISDRYSR